MNYSYTRRMEEELFGGWGTYDEYTGEYEEIINTLNSEGYFRSFGDGLIEVMRNKVPSITAENASRIINELCIGHNVDVSDIGSRNTIKSWFSGDIRPKKSEDSRRAMFALAFVLELSTEETAQLFHKVYLDRAFDYRNEKEIIYYFCLKNNKSWQYANEIISKISHENAESSDYTMYTVQIRNDVEMMENKDELVNYVRKHKNNLARKNVSARRNIDKLLNDAKMLAKREAELPEHQNGFYGKNRDSINFTYEVITDYSVTGKKGTKTIFKNARLPKEIKNRFPEAATLSKKDPTYEELRKLMILLFSYVYWFRTQTENIETDIEDYQAELNVYLDESGFSPVYYGNPYDWMFLYCAISDRPLDTFRGLLAEALGE